MSFKYKQAKCKKINIVPTLDSKHREVITKFNEQYNNLDLINNNLNLFKKELHQLNTCDKSTYTNDNIKRRSYLKDQIENLEDDIKQINNHNNKLHYFELTGELIGEYYTMLDNEDDKSRNSDEKIKILKKQTQHHKTSTTNINHISVFEYFCLSTDDTKPNSELTEVNLMVIGSTERGSREKNKEEHHKKPKTMVSDINSSEIKIRDKSILLDDYLALIDSNNMTTTKKLYTPIKECKKCKSEKLLVQAEGMYVCSTCGEVDLIIIESDKPSYKDPSPEKPAYAYKPLNHYREWLSQFQAKESVNIPKEVFDSITNELKKYRIKNYNKLDVIKMKQILKKTNLQKYYEHNVYIICKLSNKKPPEISRKLENELINEFVKIQISSRRYIHLIGRSNSLSYSYIFNKQFMMRDIPEYAAYFPLLKSRDKLKAHDKIWRLVCGDLNIKFVPS